MDADPKGKQHVVELAKRPVKERFFPSPSLVKENSIEDEELESNFMDLEPHFDVLCNVVSILPTKYNILSKIEDIYEDFNPEYMATTG